jgi:hypothetical protein
VIARPREMFNQILKKNAGGCAIRRDGFSAGNPQESA